MIVVGFAVVVVVVSFYICLYDYTRFSFLYICLLESWLLLLLFLLLFCYYCCYCCYGCDWYIVAVNVVDVVDSLLYG